MLIKTVKLKVTFDKNWGKINENEITASNETLWGKMAQEKWELLSQTIMKALFADLMKSVSSIKTNFLNKNFEKFQRQYYVVSIVVSSG